MKRLDPEQIKELLRADQDRAQPEPPPELLEAVKREIPEYLEPSATPARSGRPFWASRRLQLVAASIFVVVVGTIITSRALVDEPLVEELSRETTGAETPVASDQAVDPLGAVANRSASSSEGTSIEAKDVEGPTARSADSSPPTADRDRAAQELRESLKTLADAPNAVSAREQKADTRELGSPATAEVEQRPAPAASVVEESPDLSKQPTSRFEREDAGAPAESRDSVADSLEAEPGQVDESEPERPKVVESAQAAGERQSGVRTKNRTEAVERPDAAIAFGIVEGSPRKPAVRPRTAPPVTGHTAAPSTGGTTEPNDRPYGDVFFDPTGVNPFVDTEDDALSTFGLDVDTGSYTIARRYLEDGNLPEPAAIRVEEFVNYFDYGDPAPQRDDFAISIEGAPSPFAENSGYRLLRFGIKAREVAPRERTPATLVFVVDTSGSMEEGNRIGLVKRALTLLLDQLGPDDRVGLVEYSDQARVLLEPTRDKGEVERALRYLVPNGATNAEDGLMLGYDLAGQFFRGGGINRVILCSDGVANVGRTGPEAILERIEREARRGIEITTVGFGMGNYNDVLMEQLADRGDGRYAYVDSLEEAERIFVENLTGTLQTVARDAKIQVEFNPAAVSRYRLLGYENRDVADHRFRDNSVDAGEIGSGHTVTALYEVKLLDGARRNAELATVHLRWESTETRRVREIDKAILVGDLERSWRQAPASLRFAGIVAEFAEILKRSYWARGASLHDLSRHAEQLEHEHRSDEISALADLIEKAAWLEPEAHPSYE